MLSAWNVRVFDNVFNSRLLPSLYHRTVKVSFFKLKELLSLTETKTKLRTEARTDITHRNCCSSSISSNKDHLSKLLSKWTLACLQPENEHIPLILRHLRWGLTANLIPNPSAIRTDQTSGSESNHRTNWLIISLPGLSWVTQVGSLSVMVWKLRANESLISLKLNNFRFEQMWHTKEMTKQNFEWEGLVIKIPACFVLPRKILQQEF